MPSFAKSDEQYTTFEKRYDADGTVWMQAYAHGDLTALTPYKIIANEYGNITAALADDTKYYYVGVPAAAVSSGDIAWLQIGGYCADVVTPSLSVTAGHSLLLYDGAVADGGADFSGVAGEFAVNVSTTTSATAHDVILIPERMIGTT